MRSAPRALVHASLGQRPRGTLFSPKQALKARIKAFASIPNIAFVEFHTVFTQKIAILLLKTAGAMMLFLAPHVFENCIKLFEPGYPIFGAEDNVNDNLAERLRHHGIIAEKHMQVNRAFSADEFSGRKPGAMPQAGINIAPLALTCSRGR
jgi:hypothetical protein